MTPDPISVALQDFVANARWFGGKGREFEVSGVRRLAEVSMPDDEPRVVIDLVELTYPIDDAAPDIELYQVPLSLYTEPQHRLDHAFVGWWEDPDLGWVHAYDAVHDREAMAGWLRAFIEAPAPLARAVEPAGSGLSFHRLPV